MKLYTKTLHIVEDIDLKTLESKENKQIDFGTLPNGYILKDICVNVLEKSTSTAATAKLNVGTQKKVDAFACLVDLKVEGTQRKDLAIILDDDKLVISLECAAAIKNGKARVIATLITPTNYIAGV